ncbi:hypothetical protein SH528x_000194 [Novipirellula sp. SH528]|uniref:hypothetical protein n=1 Tax=Novipirellula sp. SH528 TaxID=3454466 RepID=UPI003FA0679C
MYHSRAGIQLPTGKFKLSIDTLYGLPTRDVVKTINEKAETHAEKIWLRGVVSSESMVWLSLLLGDSWDDSGRLAKDVDISLNDCKGVTVGTGESIESHLLSETP